MKELRTILILAFLLGGVCAHTLKAQGNVYVRAEVPLGSGNFMATVTVNLINNTPSLTRFGIDHNGQPPRVPANATAQFNITSTSQGAPNLQSLVGQGQTIRELIGLTAAHFPTTPGARYTYQINATFTPPGGGAVVNTTTPITLILINHPGGGVAQQNQNQTGSQQQWGIKTFNPGTGTNMSGGNVVVLKTFYNTRRGTIEVTKNGIIHRYGFLNFQHGSPRRALRGYRLR